MFTSFSQKQIESYAQSTARLNFWVGSVRSGKSFIALIRFVDFLRNGPPGPCFIIGKSHLTVKRNIIEPLFQLLGDDVRYKAGIGEMTLWGRVCYVVGATDERAESRIRGSSAVGALVDECTLIPESFFRMLLSRLSMPGAMLFGTSNPDSPFHWLKTSILDNTELDCKVFNFCLDDNPSLDPNYVRSLKKEFSGLWYERFIDGKWVLAEGVVFDMFNQERHVINYPPGAAETYICGVDYGTTNPCAFALIGYSSKTYPNKWLEKEYYWDSKNKSRQKTDSEYAQDLIKFINGYNVKCIYIDPSAVSFRMELIRCGITNMVEAENEVLDGIRFHSQELQNGTFKVCSNCINTIKEYGSYRWDTKASNRGEDRPIKDNDHMMDAIRYALYTHFYKSGSSRLSKEDLRRMREEIYGYPQHNDPFYGFSKM